MLSLKEIFKLILSRSGVRNPFNTIFKEIEFETTSYCNRKCSYCPNIDFERFGEDENFLMKQEVFEALINQLAELKFCGMISPHLYGEPLSDHRMLSWSKYIKKKLPLSRLKIVTNGDFLNKNNFKEFVSAGVDIFYISKHSKLLKKPCRQLLEDLDIDILNKHILVQDFFGDFNNNQSMFTNRGGSVELKKEIVKKPPVNCSYATYPVINVFGDLILCCQDFNNNYVFGNIMNKPLKDIWFDKKNIKLRKRIYDYKFDLKICKDCKM
jgi:radical SAM protein with 4Fe4S-binding SPASM domain